MHNGGLQLTRRGFQRPGEEFLREYRRAVPQLAALAGAVLAGFETPSIALCVQLSCMAHSRTLFPTNYIPFPYFPSLLFLLFYS